MPKNVFTRWPLSRWVWVGLLALVPLIYLARKPFGLVPRDYVAEWVLEIGEGVVSGEEAPARPSQDERMRAIAGQDVLSEVTEALDLGKHWDVTPGESIRRLRRHLQVTAGENENVIVLRYTGRTAHEARMIAGSIARAYEKRVRADEEARAETVLAEMRSELDAQKAKVEEARKRMLALAEKYGIESGETVAPEPEKTD